MGDDGLDCSELERSAAWGCTGTGKGTGRRSRWRKEVADCSLQEPGRRGLLQHFSRIAAGLMLPPSMAIMQAGPVQAQAAVASTSTSTSTSASTSTATATPAQTPVPSSDVAAGQRADAATRPRNPAQKETVVLVVGDSLSAEYGLARGSGWVALLDARLKERKVSARVVNASISGETTAGGRSRLAALLMQHRPTHLVIELGGNDALRGLPLPSTRDNLLSMVRSGKASGARVLLVGMQVPPNYGRAYGQEFAELFVQVARAEGTDVVPFLLQGVADGPDAELLFQPDRIHPREQAHPRMLDNVWAVLRKQLAP